MIAGPALPCPKCQRVLGPTSWHDTQKGACRVCQTEFEFTAFPRLTAARVRVVPKAVLTAEHATCFYHAANEAETVCEQCGRLVCAVCAVDFGGRRVCPPCIAAVKTQDAQLVGERALFDGIALALTVLPLLVPPVTFLTAPMALGFVIYGWNKPQSLVKPGRRKLIIAGILALLQITGWALLLGANLFGK